jgi:uncharacterized protein (TIGR02145 family)
VEGTEREHYGKSKAQFCDSRDGKKYVYVSIGSQIWMAENLSYAASGSKCGEKEEIVPNEFYVRSLKDENTAYCNEHGRLYNWGTAMTACPSGWHLPSSIEWSNLMLYINITCPYLKLCDFVATTLRVTDWKNGTDSYGFSAIPGGRGELCSCCSNCDSDGTRFSGGSIVEGEGDLGFWWTATEASSNYADIWEMTRGNVMFVDSKDNLISVRCLKDK